MRDVIVVLPGIMGSTLSRNGTPVWAPSAGSVMRAIGTFGRHIRQLELPQGIGDDHPGDGVEADELMPDLHVLPGIWTPVKGYDRLVERLRGLGHQEAAGNLVLFPYDWRLSNRYNAARLKVTAEAALERRQRLFPDARLVLVGHSMGGLVARWYVEKLGGAEVTRKLITLGTPYRGAAKALEQLVNGVRPGLGPLALDLRGFARSLPSLHQLLPEYACIGDGADLARTTEVTLPELDADRVADTWRFHDDLRRAEAARPGSRESTHAIVGIGQPTATTATIGGGRVTLADTYEGEDYAGDATVPLVAACRADVPMDSPLLRRVPDQHGNLQRNRAALNELEGVLTARDVVVRGPGQVRAGVTVPELLLAGEELTVDVTVSDRAAVAVTVTDEDGRAETTVPRLKRRRGRVRRTLTGPGAYTVDVTGTSPGSPVAPVSATVLVWDQSWASTRGTV